MFGVGPVELLVVAAIFGLWLWMLVDVLTQERDPTQKLVWVIVIVFTNILGAILYFVIRKLPRMRGSIA
jgi:phospholipase D-like protein